MRILRPRGVGKGTCGCDHTISPQVKGGQISTRALALAPRLFCSLSLPLSLLGWVRNPNIYGLLFAEEQNSCLFHQRRHAPGQVHSKWGWWSLHKALLCLQIRIFPETDIHLPNCPTSREAEKLPLPGTSVCPFLHTTPSPSSIFYGQC